MIWIWLSLGVLGMMTIGSISYFVFAVVALDEQYRIEWQETPKDGVRRKLSH